MKIKYFILILVFASSMISQRTEIAVFASPLISNMTKDNDVNTPTSSFGFNIGARVTNTSFASKHSVQLDFGYAIRSLSGSETKFTEDVLLHSVEINPAAVVNFGKSLFLTVGGNFVINIASDITPNYETQQPGNGGISVATFNILGGGGLGYRINDKVDVEFNYYHGLLNVYESKDPNKSKLHSTRIMCIYKL
jgi:hypothetical protein